MRRLLIFIIGMFLLITLSIGSYKKLNSSHYQSILLYDFNNGTDLFKLEDSKFDDNFPTLTATSLPLKYLKARYYLQIDSIETVKNYYINQSKRIHTLPHHRLYLQICI